MPQDINDRVAGYRGLVEGIAEQIAASKAAKRVGAEYDDLVQEGLIAVWQSLSRGVTPAVSIIRLRMRGWIRLQARQKDPYVESVSYETLLPLDDFRASESA